MIDTSLVRVHQHGACIRRKHRQSMGRSRGGLMSKIHAVVDSNGLLIRRALSPGEARDVRLAGKPLSRLKSRSMLLAERAMTLTGSESVRSRKERGPTSRQRAIAPIRSASALISTAPATGSSGSSTRSNNVVGSRRGQTNLSQPLDADPTHLYVPVLFRPVEGRIAIVTDVRRNAVDASVPSDVRHGFADGEGVWSWHPWAGAKRASDDLRATVTKRSWTPGRARR